MALKKKKNTRKKDEEKFDLQEEVTKDEEVSEGFTDIDSRSEFNDVISDTQILSSDPNANKIILQTYTRGKVVKMPTSTDVLITNSIKLVKAGKNILPWIDVNKYRDEFIDEAIKSSSDGSEIGDLIEDSGIIELDNDFDEYKKDKNKADSSKIEVV